MLKPSKETLSLWGRLAGADAAALLGQRDQHCLETILKLQEGLEHLGARRILLVLDEGALAASGLRAELEAQLAGLDVACFTGFTPNPTNVQGAAAAAAAQAHGAQAVLGIGGGSCLDVAKMAALAGRQPGLAESLTRGEGVERAAPLPLAAVPTTSGTGSEATHFAAIYVNGGKVSVAHPGIRPCMVVLDARLHMAMPGALAASTGLDALGQAMESLWAVGGGGESRALALAGGGLVARRLLESVNTGGEEARTAVMLGAHLAGQAINLSKTTAAHALSYQLTHQCGLSHGHAVALTLGWVGAANAGVEEQSCQDPRGMDYVRARVGEAAAMVDTVPARLPEAVRALIRGCGLPATLEEAGVPRDSLAGLAASVDPVRLGNNPRRLGTGCIRGLLERAWKGQ